MKIKAALCAVLLGLGSSPAWAQMAVPFDLMPPYEAAVVSDSEAADIYAYLRQMPAPRDPRRPG